MILTMKKSGWTLIELLIVIAILSILAATILGASKDVSDGCRVGTITKFSHKGIFNKSWEGELVMGGVRSRTDGDGNRALVANVFDFSVSDQLVTAQIQELLDSGKPAKLTYHQSFFHNPFRRDTDYIITKAEELAP